MEAGADFIIPSHLTKIPGIKGTFKVGTRKPGLEESSRGARVKPFKVLLNRD